MVDTAISGGNIDPDLFTAEHNVDGTHKAATVSSAAHSTASPFAGHAQVPMVCVYNDADIAFINSNLLTLTFNQERYDYSLMHSVVSNTSRLTCLVTGMYRIWGSLHADQNIGGTGSYIGILLNGTTMIAQEVLPTGERYASIATAYPLAVNDYVALVLLPLDGANGNIKHVDGASPIFGMERIG